MKAFLHCVSLILIPSALFAQCSASSFSTTLTNDIHGGIVSLSWTWNTATCTDQQYWGQLFVSQPYGLYPNATNIGLVAWTVPYPSNTATTYYLTPTSTFSQIRFRLFNQVGASVQVATITNLPIPPPTEEDMTNFVHIIEPVSAGDWTWATYFAKGMTLGIFVRFSGVIVNWFKLRKLQGKGHDIL